VFRTGEASSFIYFVLNGTVDLEIEEPVGESRKVATAGPGELLGWSPVLGRRAMTATARAATRCRLAALDVGQLLALCERDPHFGMAFLRQVALVVSDRLSGTRRHLARALSHRGPLGAPPEGSD
jgi:CRP-like cAMP-binding protein